MSDGSEASFATSTRLTAMGVGTVLMSWSRGRRLSRLGRRYPLRRMEDADVGQRKKMRRRRYALTAAGAGLLALWAYLAS